MCLSLDFRKFPEAPESAFSTTELEVENALLGATEFLEEMWLQE